MRYAIISDIHANLPALEAVLADKPSDARLLHLGDLVGYGAQPNEVVALLERVEGVRGNHDDAALGLMDLGWFNPDAKKSAIWTARHLTAQSRAYLEALPYENLIDDDDLPFTIVHGSPAAPHDFPYVHGTREADLAAAAIVTKLVLVGHVHRAEAFHVPTNPAAPIRHTLQRDSQTIALHAGGKYVINVGSVGQPRDREPKAAYAILDTTTRTLTWRRIGYNISAAQAAISRAGLPEDHAFRLGLGQ